MNTILTALRAAGEATRLRILALLRHGELTVSEIVDILGQSQPRVSRHLKLLCDAGLIVRFQEGTWVFYRLSHTGTAAGLLTSILSNIDGEDPDIKQDIGVLQSIRQKHFDHAQAYFTQNAEAWDKIRSLYVPEEDVEASLLALAGEEKIGSLLDIGTGTGRMLDLFHHRFEQGLGLDVSREMLSVARRNLEEKQRTNCAVVRGDMYQLEQEANSQDMILFHQVLHFADKPVLALREASRVLSPEGAILIADFAPHEEEFLRTEHAHRRLGFHEDEMQAFANHAGLTVDATEHLDGAALRVTLWRLKKLPMANTAEHCPADTQD